MSIYEIPSQLHTLLSGYKRSVVDDVRTESSLRVAALLSHFLLNHRRCIAAAAGADWDVITNVPSTKHDAEHALVGALRRVPSVIATYEPLLVRGPQAIDHNQASDQGFTVSTDVRGKRVLLVDDTYTSGARAQSAASALSLAGATVTAMVPVGRVFKPGFSDTTRAYWADRKATPFTFESCCVH